MFEKIPIRNKSQNMFPGVPVRNKTHGMIPGLHKIKMEASGARPDVFNFLRGWNVDNIYEITIDSTLIDETLTHFPVPIPLGNTITLVESITAKSVILDIADNWGEVDYLGIRSIDFYYNDTLVDIAVTDASFYATSEYSNGLYNVDYAFLTAVTKTGSAGNTQWLSALSSNTDQRIGIVFNSPTQFDKIVINNMHSSGVSTDWGVKNIKIYYSTSAITSIVYNESILNSILIFDGIIAEHTAVDEIDDQILDIDLLNTELIAPEFFDELGGIPDEVKLLLRSDSVDGNDFFEDSSRKQHILSHSGTVEHSTTEAIFNPTSIFMDASYEIIGAPASEDWYFPAGVPFTIDFQIWKSSYAGEDVFFDIGTVDYYMLANAGNIEVRTNHPSSVLLLSATAPTTSTWVHMAVERDSNHNWMLTFDGIVMDTTVYSLDWGTDSSVFHIGNYGNGTARALDGYIAEFRVVKGRNLFKGAFTPPTEPYYIDLWRKLAITKEEGTQLYVENEQFDYAYPRMVSTEDNSIGEENPGFTGGGFDGSYTGDAGGSWHAYVGSYQNTGWVGQDFGEGNAKVISTYRVYVNSVADTNPKTWTFEASHTGAWAGEEVVLDIRIDESMTGGDWDEYSVINTTAYRYYRLDVTANNGNSTYLVITEIEFYESFANVVLHVSKDNFKISDTEDTKLHLYYDNTHDDNIEYVGEAVQKFTGVVLEADTSPYTGTTLTEDLGITDGEKWSGQTGAAFLEHNAYGIDLKSKQTIDYLMIYCTHASGGSLTAYYGTGYDSMKVLKSDDNASWELVETFDAPPITVSEAYHCGIKLEFFEVQIARYFKVVSIDTNIAFTGGVTGKVQEIEVYSENGFASQNVWNENYKAVYNMAQDPSGGDNCIIDSTSNSNYGTPSLMDSTNLIDGLIGKALYFSGVNQYIANEVDLGLLGDFDGSIEAVINPDNITGAYIAVCIAGAAALNQSFSMVISDGKLGCSYNGGALIDTDNICISVGTRVVVAITKEAGVMNVTTALYVDGELKDSAGTASTPNFVEGVNRTATWTNLAYDYAGIIESLRWSNVQRSAAWIKASNAALTNNLLTIVKKV